MALVFGAMLMEISCWSLLSCPPINTKKQVIACVICPSAKFDE